MKFGKKSSLASTKINSEPVNNKKYEYVVKFKEIASDEKILIKKINYVNLFL